MGITRDHTSSYHPQHNGKIERMHRCLKNSLRSCLLGKSNWMAELPWAMLGLRATSNLDTGVSPSILVTGQRSRHFQHNLFFSALKSMMRQLMVVSWHRFTQNPWHGKENARAKVSQAVWTAKRVLLRSDKVQPSLEPKYTGPFRVIRR